MTFKSLPKILWAPANSARQFREPVRKTDGSVGYDFVTHAFIEARYGIPIKVRTNLTCFMPDNFYAELRPKSGISSRYSMVVLGGVIDSDYQDEWIFNFVLVPRPDISSDGHEEFMADERIGQILFHEKLALDSQVATTEEVAELHRKRQELAVNKRTGGHGSTGRF